MRRTGGAVLAALIGLSPAARAGEPVVYREVGTASYYGAELAGQRTASGARYDPAQLTAAHPTLPLGAEVTVVALATGRKVEVRITDRGPFTGGRDIDLSRRAAEVLGITAKGVARVRITATEEQLARADAEPAATK